MGVDPKELTRQHLLAEHREIKRIPNMVKSGRFSLTGQPAEFKLGPGHVKFFYDKLGYLLRRYLRIYEECVSRGYTMTDFSSIWDDIPEEYMGDYIPRPEDRELVLGRIRERLSEKTSKINSPDF